jgi:hypothetical protein
MNFGRLAMSEAVQIVAGLIRRREAAAAGS